MLPRSVSERTRTDGQRENLRCEQTTRACEKVRSILLYSSQNLMMDLFADYAYVILISFISDWRVRSASLLWRKKCNCCKSLLPPDSSVWTAIPVRLVTCWNSRGGHYMWITIWKKQKWDKNLLSDISEKTPRKASLSYNDTVFVP